MNCNTLCATVKTSQCELCSVLLVIWEEFVLATQLVTYSLMYKSAHLCCGVICEGHSTNVVLKLVGFISMNKSFTKKRSLFLCYIQLKNIFTIISY
jgi:3,4-dihydroxy-2-butanone 4-phosphate synthase